AMIHDAAFHLADRERALQSVYPTGSRLAMSGSITDPMGKASTGAIPIERRGAYRLDHAGIVTPFGVALLSEAETLLNGSGPPPSAASVAQGHPLAFWLIILALIILVAESILYHRRKAG
ncbi:MAG: hypothetical protein MUF13_01970, partial [Akkermansiaceae bacterium]|nr:hypothetical protein [Akkermansiaceae bacterium]